MRPAGRSDLRCMMSFSASIADTADVTAGPAGFWVSGV
jgi:hypothetical protein